MLGLFSKGHRQPCTLLVDIGSGSVAMALLTHPSLGKDAEIIWSKREHAIIGDVNDIKTRQKRVIGTLVNMFLQLGADGFKTLRSLETAHKVTSITVAVAAPWSYTATHVVDYKQPESFSVSQSLIDNLSDSAHETITEQISESSLLKNVNISTLSVHCQGAQINDYILREFDGTTKTDSLSLFYTAAMTSTFLVESLEEGIDKVIPHTDVSYDSFMFYFYRYIQDKYAHIKEYTLIDVTSEASEIGIIQGGALHTVANAPYGTYSIAREIASITNLTNEEAHSLMQMDATEVTAQPQKIQDALEDVRASYASNLAALFEEAKDDLFIPHSIYLLCDTELQPFIIKTLNEITTAAKLHVSIHPISHALFLPAVHNDPALSLLANRALADAGS